MDKKKENTPVNWRKHPMMWVVGAIDSNSHIVGTAVRGGRVHNESESKGCKFRFSIHSQDFFDVLFGYVKMKPEEYFSVCDWLIRNNYADDKILNRAK